MAKFNKIILRQNTVCSTLYPLALSNLACVCIRAMNSVLTDCNSSPFNLILHFNILVYIIVQQRR